MARRTLGRSTEVEAEEKGDDGMPVSRRSESGGFSRRKNSGDEESEKPKRGTSTAIGKGWGAATATVKSGDFKNGWKPEDGVNLIHFLQPEPFAVTQEHWFKREEKPEGKLSYICLGEDCPLCAEGIPWVGNALFNILVITDPDNPAVVHWSVKGKIFDSIKVYADDERSRPIDKVDSYFEVVRTGKGLQTRYNINRIRSSDVKEEYKFDPYTAEELDEFRKELVTEEEAVFVNTREQLLEVLNDLS